MLAQVRFWGVGQGNNDRGSGCWGWQGYGGGKGTTEDQQVQNTAISAIFGEYGSNF